MTTELDMYTRPRHRRVKQCAVDACGCRPWDSVGATPRRTVKSLYLPGVRGFQHRAGHLGKAPRQFRREQRVDTEAHWHGSFQGRKEAFRAPRRSGGPSCCQSRVCDIQKRGQRIADVARALVAMRNRSQKVQEHCAGVRVQSTEVGYESRALGVQEDILERQQQVPADQTAIDAGPDELVCM